MAMQDELIQLDDNYDYQNSSIFLLLFGCCIKRKFPHEPLCENQTRLLDDKIKTVYHPQDQVSLSQIFPQTYKLLQNDAIEKKIQDLINSEQDLKQRFQTQLLKGVLRLATAKQRRGTCKSLEYRQELLTLIGDKKWNAQQRMNQIRDPFIMFGIGIVSYRRLLKQLILMFMIITVLVLPVFYIYHDNKEIKIHESRLSQWSLGNMGFMKTHCEFAPFTLNKVVLQCPYGVIQKIFPGGHGINSFDQVVRDACLVEPKFGNDKCMGALNSDQLIKEFQGSCLGENQCIIYLKDNDQNLRPQIFPNASAILGDPQSPYFRCLDNMSQIFMQFACAESEEQTQRKYKQLSMVSCIFSFVAVVFSLSLIYFKMQAEIEDRKYDIETVTADDYTVQLMLSKNQVKQFKKTHKKEIKEHNGSVAQPLKKYLMDVISKKMNVQGYCRMKVEMEENIKRLQRVYCNYKKKEYADLDNLIIKYRQSYQPDKISKKQDFSIADIQFAFNTRNLIKLMKERGDCVTKGDFEGVKRMNYRITKYLQSKRGRSEVNTVLSAYLTFNTEEGHDEAQNYIKNPTKYIKEFDIQRYNNVINVFTNKNMKFQKEKHDELLGEKMIIDQAGNPSNIIWENKCINGCEKLKLIFICSTVVILMTSIAFWAIIKIKIKSIELNEKYVNVKCVNFYNMYTDGEILEQSALHYLQEEQILNGLSNYTIAPGIGAISCFCTNETNQVEYDKKFTFHDGLGNQRSEPICNNFLENAFQAQFLTKLCAVMIAVINQVITTGIVHIMSKVGEHTHSKKSSRVAVSVFFLQFLNTGILLLLVTANFKEQGIDPYHLFHGSRTDFGMLWYSQTGDTIVETMIISNIIMPIIMQILQAFVRFCKRHKDQNKGIFSLRDKCKKKDKNQKKHITYCKSEQQYINIHVGPQFEIDFRYSRIMNIVYVTMMYGVGLPILFPIAVISLMVIYFLDVICLFYVYRQPPKYDSSLHKQQLRQMEGAVLVFLAFGFWQISNNQLLPYDGMPLEPQERSSTEFKSHHIWSQYVYGSWEEKMFLLGPAIPMYIFFCLLWFIFLMYIPIRWLKQNYEFFRENLTILGQIEQIEEGFHSYFKSINKQEINWTYVEEKLCRNQFKYATMPKKTLQRYHGQAFNDNQVQSCQIEGIYSYNLLKNPLYFEQFQYGTYCIQHVNCSRAKSKNLTWKLNYKQIADSVANDVPKDLKIPPHRVSIRNYTISDMVKKMSNMQMEKTKKLEEIKTPLFQIKPHEDCSPDESYSLCNSDDSDNDTITLKAQRLHNHMKEHSIRSDLIKLAFDLPYMSKHCQKNFEFSAKGYKQLIEMSDLHSSISPNDREDPEIEEEQKQKEKLDYRDNFGAKVLQFVYDETDSSSSSDGY